MVTRPVAERELLAFLRDAYGIVGVEPRHGTNHDYVDFDYDGKSHHITINHRDKRGFNLKRQDIMRELGPPPAEPFNPPTLKRRLDDMLPNLPMEMPIEKKPVAIPKPIVGSCRVACYGSPTNSYRFVFTTDFAASAFPSGRVLCEQAPNGESWLFRESPNGRELRPSAARAGCFEYNLAQGNATPFRMTTATIDDLPRGNGVRVTVPMSERRPPAGVRREEAKAEQQATRRTPAGTPMPVPVLPDPTQLPAEGWKPIPATKEPISPRFLRNILKEIVAAERDSAYRLVRVKMADGERWEWRAPSIRLDDSGAE